MWRLHIFARHESSPTLSVAAPALGAAAQLALTVSRMFTVLLAPQSLALVTMAIARARPISMGGFDQQALKPDGGRVSLIVKGTADLVGTLPAALRKEAADGVTGIIYAINDERLEIIAEGEVATLEPLAEYVEAKALSDGAECVQSWQLPGGGYSAEFPVVRAAKRRAPPPIFAPLFTPVPSVPAAEHVAPATSRATGHLPSGSRTPSLLTPLCRCRFSPRCRWS